MNAMANKHMEPRRDAGGFSMVEVLVALVVLGVGMLGIASLYVVTLRSSGSAISRMQAVNLASDIGDRIRANRTAGSAYALAAAEGEVEEAEAATSCVTNPCSPAAMAAYDLEVWQQQIARTLPGASGSIDIDDSETPWTYTVRVDWTESGNEALSYEMRMQL